MKALIGSLVLGIILLFSIIISSHTNAGIVTTVDLQTGQIHNYMTSNPVNDTYSPYTNTYQTNNQSNSGFVFKMN